ncbi:mutator type transposase [Tanacetum coccineum]
MIKLHKLVVPLSQSHWKSTIAGALHKYLAGLTLVDRWQSVLRTIHGSSNFVTHKKEVSIAVDNHLRKGPIEINSSPDVNKTLTPMCHRNLTKEWKQPSSSVEAPIVVECAVDPFEELDDTLGEYAHTGKQITGNEITRNEITGNEITGKQLVVHVGNSFIVDDVLELEMLFKTEGVGHVGKFKKVEVDADNESEEESNTEGGYTSGSDSDDSNYDPKHDEVFDDDEHIVEDVDVSMNNFCFTADPKHDISICAIEVQEDELNVINYDSFGSDLDDGIDSERRIQLKELRKIGKNKNKGPNKYYFYLGQQFASKERVTGRVRMHSVETRRKLIMAKMKFRKQKVVQSLETITLVASILFCPVIRDHNIRWEIILYKSLATNPNIHVRAVQDQMQKQFDVGVSKMKAFKEKRIVTDKMTGSITVKIVVQQELNPDSMTRTFRRVYLCMGALKQGFRACGKDILELDGCFMAGPWPCQILTTVGFDANNGIYPVAYAIVEAESKASWCWFLSLLGEDLGIEANFNYTFIFDKQKLVDGRDQPIITCLEYIREYLMKRIVVVQKVIAKIVGPLTPSVTKLFDAIKKATEYIAQWNGGFLYQVTGPYKDQCVVNMETREIWPVVEATTVIVPPLYKPQFGKPSNKRKKSHDEIENESCSSGKFSKKDKSVRCDKCRNVGHNRKCCRGQGGASNVSSQSVGSSQPIAAQSTSTGVRNASSQPSAAPSTASQGPIQHSARPRQSFQAPRLGFPTQRLTKVIASRHSLRKLSS